MKNYVFALLSIGFIIYGCNKDDDDDDNKNNDQEKVKLMTSMAWKYDTVAIADNTGKPVSPLPPGVVENCDKDNTITFRTDSTGTLNEGTLVCSGSAQNTNFKWWFKENGTILYTPDDIFGNSSFTGDFKVIELTSTKLRVTKQVTIAPYPSTNIVLDLKH